MGEYKRNHTLICLQNHSLEVLIVLGQGAPKSTIFSAGENTPVTFDQSEFDQSLQKFVCLLVTFGFSPRSNPFSYFATCFVSKKREIIRESLKIALECFLISML